MDTAFAWKDENRARGACPGDFIAYCGLDCETCEARLATVKDDPALRARAAAEWSELNRGEITPEMKDCGRLGAITGNNPDALRRLEKAGL